LSTPKLWHAPLRLSLSNYEENTQGVTKILFSLKRWNIYGHGLKKNENKYSLQLGYSEFMQLIHGWQLDQDITNDLKNMLILIFLFYKIQKKKLSLNHDLINKTIFP